MIISWSKKARLSRRADERVYEWLEGKTFSISSFSSSLNYSTQNLKFSSSLLSWERNDSTKSVKPQRDGNLFTCSECLFGNTWFSTFQIENSGKEGRKKFFGTNSSDRHCLRGDRTVKCLKIYSIFFFRQILQTLRIYAKNWICSIFKSFQLLKTY